MAGRLTGKVALISGGAGGWVNVSNTAAIATAEVNSPDILAQSIGGGGGSGGSTLDAGGAGSASISIAVGGSGGSGGGASAVTVENPGGVLTTQGAFSQGLLAQSVGGGGGAGGSSANNANSGAYTLSLGLGGSGGTGGVGIGASAMAKRVVVPKPLVTRSP